LKVGKKKTAGLSLKGTWTRENHCHRKGPVKVVLSSAKGSFRMGSFKGGNVEFCPDAGGAKQGKKVGREYAGMRTKWSVKGLVKDGRRIAA